MLCPSDMLTTRRLAQLLHVKPRTILQAHGAKKSYLGMIPTKLGNRRLLWPRSAAESLISGREGQ